MWCHRNDRNDIIGRLHQVTEGDINNTQQPIGRRAPKNCSLLFYSLPLVDSFSEPVAHADYVGITVLVPAVHGEGRYGTVRCKRKGNKA